MSRYSGISNSTTPLTLDVIARTCPSILASHAHEDRKESYKFIPTSTLLSSMGERGFLPFSIHQTNPRKNVESRMGFTRHAISFRHESTFGQEEEIVPQVVILNSHDGTTPYKIYAGFFRFVCSNGLICGSVLESFSVYHKGNAHALDDVIDASFTVLDSAQKAIEYVDDWKAITLSDTERLEMATRAHAIKFGADHEMMLNAIRPEQFLEAHNAEDYGNSSLWSTFNVLQENIMKGGLQGNRYRNHEGVLSKRRPRTRSISNITQSLALNTALWDMATDYANNIITL